jgi:hypothetical protein
VFQILFLVLYLRMANWLRAFFDGSGPPPAMSY